MPRSKATTQHPKKCDSVPVLRIHVGLDFKDDATELAVVWLNCDAFLGLAPLGGPSYRP